MRLNWIQENEDAVLLIIDQEMLQGLGLQTNVCRFYEKKYTKDTRSSLRKKECWLEFFDVDIHSEALDLLMWSGLKKEYDKKGSLHYGHFILCDISQ